jgi:hypothetical protein
MNTSATGTPSISGKFTIGEEIRGTKYIGEMEFEGRNMHWYLTFKVPIDQMQSVVDRRVVHGEGLPNMDVLDEFFVFSFQTADHEEVSLTTKIERKLLAFLVAQSVGFYNAPMNKLWAQLTSNNGGSPFVLKADVQTNPKSRKSSGNKSH